MLEVHFEGTAYLQLVNNVSLNVFATIDPSISPQKSVYTQIREVQNKFVVYIVKKQNSIEGPFE